mgnify:CR=1 FL=1|tara:strand:+ start:2748 stop:4025 length:1278 start_codon:yes stop_codon:yes gene_type:complete
MKNSRRSFIKKSAITFGAFTIVPRHVLGNGFIAPSDKFSLGVIGSGTQSRGLASGFIKMAETQLIAACDVNSKKMAEFNANFFKSVTETDNNISQLKTYIDYHELLKRDDIDGVIVSTPDHWHAIASIDSMRAGKHVYCEKPLSHTIEEGRAMVNASRKYKKILQTGSMQRSSYNFRQAVGLIRNGYLGKIEKVLVNVGNPYSKCNLPYQPTPKNIDWERWIGPAPMRAYHSTLVDADFFPRWRWYKEFGGGVLADWGAHMFDIVQWALDMDDSGPVKLLAPREPNAVKGLIMNYSNGIEVVHEDFHRGFGVRFIGSKGTLDVSRGYLDSNVKGLVKTSLKGSKTDVYFSDDHLKDWIDSVKNNTLPICDAEIGHRSASVCHLGNIAYELREELNWDPKEEVFIENNKANFMKSKFYRNPYLLTE